jgi:hypothetical protein
MLALAQHQPVEFDALVELGVRLRRHIGGGAAEPRPHRDEVVPAGGKEMQFVGHFDLPRQRRRQPDQHGGLAEATISTTMTTSAGLSR